MRSPTEQRQQSRLVAEIVAERRLPERIAAERSRRDTLRRALGAKDADPGDLSPEQRSELVAAVPELDPDLADQVYRSVTGPTGWLRIRRLQISQVLRAIPRMSLVYAAIFAGACVAVFVFASSIYAHLTAAVVAGLGMVGLIWSQLEAIDAALSIVASARDRVRDLVDPWRRQTQTALEVSEATVAALERELQDLTAAGQLAGMVSDRVSEGGYRRSLGLMTQIREDFEHMSALLTRDHTEHDAPRREEIRVPDAGGDTLPRIDRIVLYVDDLDRCPPSRVVELLEAVHLLLAVPLFVVVVAVDPRWLLRAIAVHYRDVLDAGRSPAPTVSGRDIDPDDESHWASTPSQYLEKIFQVVYTLPPLTTSGYRSMLNDLVGARADSKPPPGPRETGEAGAFTGTASDVTVGPEAAEATDDNDDALFDLAVELPAARTIERIDPLAFDTDELALIRLLGPPLITTPRSVKRLANSYGLLTAIGRLRHPESTSQGRRPGLVLLASLVGFPNLGPALLTHLYRVGAPQPTADKRTTEHNAEPATWQQFVAGLTPTYCEERQCWSSDADRHQTPAEAHSWRALAHALTTITDATDVEGSGITLPASLSSWTGWVIPVGRLSFPAGRVVVGLQRTHG
ncbi:P-loop NTPase fold protein [Rhodococcus opacus]|uniref:P-loop NTPase fold protein n=1 Tax=Rhodococcus opacus TaxID=37919 RepID=UPI001B312F92|nr:P-loop NTPase fold protein [Rhodococcus opacus]